jgi:hypothetical protein
MDFVIIKVYLNYFNVVFFKKTLKVANGLMHHSSLGFWNPILRFHSIERCHLISIK